MKKRIIAIPAEDVEYEETLRIYNVKIPDDYISKKELEEKIEKILKTGHGGGNWRRLVMNLSAKFKLKQ